ncbi:MAG: alkaline phosphatase family protein [Bacteroidia bacterium]|nr:alkaline phosphatase family protein [Bacteroidia bacterium]NNF81497.1 alkaline phosphatase family protein [Flavobacteriaceae bacterium]NNL81038.1 alkaline phosphatase family protein [Flavobacteriaceae bacterium]
MSRIISLLSIIIFGYSCVAANIHTDRSSTDPIPEFKTERPKLVVGIVVDQMRYDYLTRFEEKYSKGGFMRLIGGGFNCKNAHFNYIPTYTGPGHASVYSGTTPRYHGIISNNWYDKTANSFVYCAEDQSVTSVGTPTDAGKMSPHRMISSTVTDENRLFTQMRGKTIGISIKDRGAVLPAGHTANAAYWFQGANEGNFISSTYYMEELPRWVTRFNNSKAVENYLKTWNTLYDINTYSESGDDMNAFEWGYDGKEAPTFPYELDKLAQFNGNFDILKTSPYGNSIVTDFSIEALKNEDLGKDSDTDFLAISYSSTDYIGHNFGVNSKEVQDVYLRLDLEIEKLLNTLDKEVGEGNYTVFLTSDHGAVNVPNYLKSVGIPAGLIDGDMVKNKFLTFLEDEFGSTKVVANASNNQMFLDRTELKRLKLDLDEVCGKIVDELITYDHIDKAFASKTINNGSFTEGIELLLKNGYNQKRSGEVIVVNNPAFISYSETGSTHGSGLNYDTHVPMLFYGSGVKAGESVQYVRIVDLAPTISALLGISFPNAATGKPLEFVLD